MSHVAGGQLPGAGHRFVVGVVDVEVLARQVRSRLAAVKEILGEVDPRVVAGPFADHQHIARDAAGLVDQGGRGGPVGVVERGPVQRRKDAVEGIEWVHDTSCQRLPAAGRRRREALREMRHTPHKSREAAILPSGRYGGRGKMQAGCRRRPGSYRRRRGIALGWRHCIEGFVEAGTLFALRDRVVEFDRACRRVLTGKDAASRSRAGASPCSNWTDDVDAGRPDG